MTPDEPASARRPAVSAAPTSVGPPIPRPAVSAAPTDPRDARVVRGLSADDEQQIAAAYFAAFRWEPPAIDPAWLTAADFLSMLDDALVTHDAGAVDRG